MPSEQIVHIVDDDDAARQSLAFLLETSGFAVHAYASATAFLDVIATAAAGCIVTDVRMPGIGGIDLMRRLRELDIGWPVIVVTGHADVGLAIDAVKMGAVDFIEKPYDGEQLIAAVQYAFHSPAAGQDRGSERQEIAARLASLTARERQVLDGLLAGRTNKLIAGSLGLAETAVEITRAGIMTKMQAGTLSHLVRLALLASA